jgi:hypothetical protein
MPNTAAAWLDARTVDAPASLRTRMTRALAGAPEKSDSLPHVLADAALAELERVLAHPSERPAAFDLLAADALLTYAFEAAAEQGGDAVVNLCNAYSPARFDELLATRVRDARA